MIIPPVLPNFASKKEEAFSYKQSKVAVTQMSKEQLLEELAYLFTQGAAYLEPLAVLNEQSFELKQQLDNNIPRFSQVVLDIFKEDEQPRNREVQDNFNREVGRLKARARLLIEQYENIPV